MVHCTVLYINMPTVLKGIIANAVHFVYAIMSILNIRLGVRFVS